MSGVSATSASIRRIHSLTLGNLMAETSVTRLRRWCAKNGILPREVATADECKEAIRGFFFDRYGVKVLTCERCGAPAEKYLAAVPVCRVCLPIAQGAAATGAPR